MESGRIAKAAELMITGAILFTIIMIAVFTAISLIAMTIWSVMQIVDGDINMGVSLLLFMIPVDLFVAGLALASLDEELRER